MTTQLQKLQIEEVVTHPSVEAAVIWLHGLGASGHDFVDIVPELKLSDEFGIRFIFPHAPNRPVTINRGMVMRAWYDITSLTRLEDDITGIEESTQQVQQLIREQEEKGIASNRIFLVGFSQGGAIAFHAGLNYPHALGGLLGLSTYLPAPHKIPQADNFKKNMPIMILHGDYDDVIPLPMAKLGYEFLLSRGFRVTWQQYPMAHQVCPSEIADIKQWFTRELF